MKKLVAAAAGAMVLTVIAVAILMTAREVSLVRTRGISMEPGFVAGDLAVLRRASDYAVGDVATYRSNDLDTAVMHRIVAIDADMFTFQGDNNDWLDPERATRDQLTGKLMLRVPQGGRWLDRTTSPAALSAMTFLVLAGSTTAATRPRRRRRKEQRKENGMAKRSTTKHLAPPAPVWMVTAGAIVLAIGATVLALLAASLPTPSEAVAAPAKGASMTFSYEATVMPSAAYDDTTVTQPQPIFRKLADEVDVTFAYSGPELFNATVRTSAVLTTPNGWRSTVPLDQDAAFSGTTYQGSVRVQISHLQAKADAAATAIGSGPSGDLSIVVVPELVSADTTFRAELPFTLDAAALRLTNGDKTPLIIDQAPVPAGVSGPSTPNVLGHDLTAQALRQTAAGAALLALVLGTGTAVVARRHKAAPQDLKIQRRFGSQLLSVEPVVLPPGRRVIDVPDIEGLVRLAERYGLLVLHWDRGGIHTYIVFEDDTTYRFRAGAAEVNVTDAVGAAAANGSADRPWLTAGS